MKKLAVPHHNNLVNIVKLRSLTQERDERVRPFFARIIGMASICELSVTCTKVGCNKRVSYTEHEILNILVKGLYDTETRREVLSKKPQLDLDATILFVEARETGKRSANVLSGETIASNKISKTTVSEEGVSMNRTEVKETARCIYCGGSGHDKSPETEFSRQRCPAWEKECTEVADNACCKYCDKPGHGKSPDAEVRKKKCPAWGEECSSCEKKGHFRKVCKKKDSANTTSIGLGRIACTEIGETACCRYYGKSGHGKEPGKELRKLRCPA